MLGTMLPEIKILPEFVRYHARRDLVDYVRHCYRTLESHPDFAETLAWGGLNISALKKLDGATPIMNVQRLVESRFPGITMIDDMSSTRRTADRYGGETAWHIDADGAGTLQHHPCFNMWLPLDVVGTDLPSIELVKGSEKKMQTMPLLNDGIRTDEWRREQFPDNEVICPKLSPGDAVLFSHFVLHRTQPLFVGKGKERLSCEIRFTTKSVTAYQALTHPFRFLFGQP